MPTAPLAGLAGDAQMGAHLRSTCAAAGLAFPGIAPPQAERVWRFETAQLQPPFAAPTLLGVWNRPPYTLTLRLLAASGGAEKLLGQARIGTQGSWRDLRKKLRQVAGVLLCQALRGVAPASLDPAGPERRGHWLDLPGALLRRAGFWWRWRWYRERWSIGIAETDILALVRATRPAPTSWLEPAAGVTILADPFISADGDLVCEEQVGSAPGAIVRFAPTAAGGFVRQEVLMSGPIHLSYPCLFSYEDETYMVPESVGSDAARIWLWARSREASRSGAGSSGNGGNRFAEIAMIAAGDKLADPTLFQWGQHVWLAATRLDLGPHDNLCLYHAPALAGPWTPHAGNPVKIDIASARPAGAMFWREGRLYRPAQDCAAGYGAAVVLHEITALSESRFEERAAGRIAPDPAGLYPDGLHTVAIAGGRTVIDGKRLVSRLELLRAKRAGRRPA